MYKSVQEIISLANQFEKSLVAEAKKKEKKKLDPKAKVRNRGTVCVPASQAKDKKDHFPINNIDQARNALARVHQYSSVPSWYKGSLKGLQSLVSRKVHSKYPSIGKSEKKTKKSDLEVNLQKVGSDKVELFLNNAIRSLEALKSRYSNVDNNDLAAQIIDFSQKVHHGAKRLMEGAEIL